MNLNFGFGWISGGGRRDCFLTWTFEFLIVGKGHVIKTSGVHCACILEYRNVVFLWEKYQLDSAHIHILFVFWFSVFETGEKLLNFLAEPKKKVKWPESIPKFSSRPEALAVCKKLNDIGYLHRCEKSGKGEVAFLPRSRCEFEEDGYFAWIYEGNKTFSHFLTRMLVLLTYCSSRMDIWKPISPEY